MRNEEDYKLFGLKNEIEQIREITLEQVKKHPTRAKEILIDYRHILYRNDLTDALLPHDFRKYTDIEYKDANFRDINEKQLLEIWTKSKTWK